MWLKLAGSALVIVSGALLGFTLAARYQSRPRQVRQLINGIGALQSHIRYAATPLAEAIGYSANGLAGPVAELFKEIGQSLSRHRELSPQQAIRLGLASSGDDLALRAPEKEALILFGENLGQMNRDEQERHCELLLTQLSAIERDAIGLRDQNTVMYRYLGICGGIATVILFI